MRTAHFSYLSILAVGYATGCSGAVEPASEPELGITESALASNGVTANVSKVTDLGNTYNAQVTITNLTKETLSNWQVSIDFHTGSFLASGVVGAVATMVAGHPIFTAPLTNGSIAPGHTYVFSFNGNKAGSSYAPTVSMVDGMAPGTVNAGNPADGVDPIARAVATAALGVAYRYVNDKLPESNPKDGNHYMYTDLIWDSHSYRLASDNKSIEFDPNVPGYRFIPNSAKAELAFAQLDPSVASYMATGLESCFQQVNYDVVYALSAGFLADVTIPKGGSASRMNRDHTYDNFETTILSVNGTMEFKVVETSTTDEWFGMLTRMWERTYAVSQDALIAKYNSAGQSAGCSPFNGPGGSSNPYLVISLNGVQVPAHFSQESPNDCTKGCTSTAIIDPVPYAEPGDYYDSNNNLVGTQSNPFAILNTTLYADPAHSYQWATRTANGTQEWGTFANPVTVFGSTKYKYVKKF